MSQRPIYETEQDLASEREVAGMLAERFNCLFSKMPIRYNLDYALKKTDDRCIGYCEIKSRKYSMAEIDNFGGYLMSVGKWASAKNLCESSCVPFLLAVRTTDGVWAAKFKPHTNDFRPDGVLVRGRKDRGDWQDVEPCVLLNVSRFKKFYDL